MGKAVESSGGEQGRKPTPLPQANGKTALAEPLADPDAVVT
jgi:hypothetical protein